jgi:ArsR family transcriptional regulator
MSDLQETTVPTLETEAAKVAALLQLIGNEKRLLILCRLVEQGEATVGALAASVQLSQSALSQHLARMRDEGLVTTRRHAQTIWYRIADPRTETLLETLHSLYCRVPKSPQSNSPQP